jgi:hypothetical protein
VVALERFERFALDQRRLGGGIVPRLGIVSAAVGITVAVEAFAGERARLGDFLDRRTAGLGEIIETTAPCCFISFAPAPRSPAS